MTLKSLALAAAATVLVVGAAQARDQIRIVGSSTVYPFTTAVAEQFGKGGKFKTPVVESTGTGGGFKLFCAGIGEVHPDLTNASRAINKSEFADCEKNGVKMTEIKVGFDGIVFANAKSAPTVNITKGQIWLALAKEVPMNGKMAPNPYKTWNEIDKSLPNAKIEVLGPPPTSGTRDSFVELVLQEGCAEIPAAKELGVTGSKCAAMREDGSWIDAGENDNLIVQKLVSTPTAFGVFGYSFLDQNIDKIKGANVEGVVPTFENIQTGKYKVARPLFVYAKQNHVGSIPGIKEFVTEYTSERAWGNDGYLGGKGLVPLPDADRKKGAQSAQAMTPFTM
ncbi:MAG: phosphate transporter substrate-binding protein [Rhodospirillales bacterium]|nr:phosphate transporter substrate-binding protein [Rhodospirillales bacterium]